MKSETPPLDYRSDLVLRKTMSSVTKSSVMDVWRAAPIGLKANACWRFVKARLGVGKLSSEEFIKFGFCEGAHADAEISTFLGKRAQLEFHDLVNDRTWHAVAKNKLLFETVMRGASLPRPQTIAVYDRKGRGHADLLLDNDTALKTFLKQCQNYPLFCKPTTGLLSIGSFRIDGLEGENLRINGQYNMRIDAVIEYIKGLSPKGYLFQRVLYPHAELAALNGDAIASVRFVVLNPDGRPSIHACSIKLPSPGEVADNFWRSGAMLCAVDADCGKISRAILNHNAGIEVVEFNPVTKQRLTDFQLPDFEAAKKILLNAARLLPGIRIQSWDIAFTDQGPILLEVNDGGDLNLIQIASGQGIYVEGYKSLVSKHL